MSGYTPGDMTTDYEFKILRGDFRDHEKLRKVLEEESRYGWNLIETFDHRRIRLKRRNDERMLDYHRPGNPYRTDAWQRSDLNKGVTMISLFAALVLVTGVILMM